MIPLEAIYVLSCTVIVPEIPPLLEETFSNSHTPEVTVTVRLQSQAGELFRGGDGIWSLGTKQKNWKLSSYLKGRTMQICKNKFKAVLGVHFRQMFNFLVMKIHNVDLCWQCFNCMRYIVRSTSIENLLTIYKSNLWIFTVRESNLTGLKRYC